jgi:hypothetical protein
VSLCQRLRDEDRRLVHAVPVRARVDRRAKWIVRETSSLRAQTGRPSNDGQEDDASFDASCSRLSSGQTPSPGKPFTKMKPQTSAKAVSRDCFAQITRSRFGPPTA